MLSPTGLCRAFSAEADGYVRAEGGVVLVLRKSSLAAANNNQVHGVILASETNSDGRTNGISLPSGEAQERLLSRIYRARDIPADRLAFVEAHGTGTPVGDPIEANAIGRSLGQRSRAAAADRLDQDQHRPSRAGLGPCRHAEGAAGAQPRHPARVAALQEAESEHRVRGAQPRRLQQVAAAAELQASNAPA